MSRRFSALRVWIALPYSLPYRFEDGSNDTSLVVLSYAYGVGAVRLIVTADISAVALRAYIGQVFEGYRVAIYGSIAYLNS